MPRHAQYHAIPSARADADSRRRVAGAELPKANAVTVLDFRRIWVVVSPCNGQFQKSPG